MNKDNNEKNDLTGYRLWGLTVLQLMAIIGIAGIAIYLIGHWLLG